MNLGYIRTLVRKRLGETTPAFWQDSELNGYINDGIQDIAYKVKCVVKQSTFTANSDQAEYSMQGSLPICWAITELYFYNVQTQKWFKLRSTSRTELDDTNPGWKSAPSSLPYQYWWDRELDVINIYPKPDIQYVSDQCVQAYYATQAPAISSDSDSPAIPQPLHLAIVDYAVAFAFGTRGWSEKENDAWGKYATRMSNYETERGREREDDNIIMKNYKNRISL